MKIIRRVPNVLEELAYRPPDDLPDLEAAIRWCGERIAADLLDQHAPSTQPDSTPAAPGQRLGA